MTANDHIGPNNRSGFCYYANNRSGLTPNDHIGPNNRSGFCYYASNRSGFCYYANNRSGFFAIVDDQSLCQLSFQLFILIIYHT